MKYCWHPICSYPTPIWAIISLSNALDLFFFIVKLLYAFILIFRKLSEHLGGLASLSFFQQLLKQNFHFCYVNCNRNYLINCVEQLFQGRNSTMFVINDIFVVHQVDHHCSLQPDSPLSHSKHNVFDFI